MQSKNFNDQVAVVIFYSNMYGFIKIGSIPIVPVPCYGPLISFIKTFQGIPFVPNYIEQIRLSDWDRQERIPPLPDDVDQDGKKKYPTYTDYYIAYKEWRGNSCEKISFWDWVPVLGGKSFFFCWNDPTKPNYWANLFPNIPTVNRGPERGAEITSGPNV
jgi:hypothetical protein